MGVREDCVLRDGASPSALERCAISATMHASQGSPDAAEHAPERLAGSLPGMRVSPARKCVAGMLADFDSSVTTIAAQPFQLTGPDGARSGIMCRTFCR